MLMVVFSCLCAPPPPECVGSWPVPGAGTAGQPPDGTERPCPRHRVHCLPHQVRLPPPRPPSWLPRSPAWTSSRCSWIWSPWSQGWVSPSSPSKIRKESLVCSDWGCSKKSVAFLKSEFNFSEPVHYSIHHPKPSPYVAKPAPVYQYIRHLFRTTWSKLTEFDPTWGGRMMTWSYFSEKPHAVVTPSVYEPTHAVPIGTESNKSQALHNCCRYYEYSGASFQNNAQIHQQLV